MRRCGLIFACLLVVLVAAAPARAFEIGMQDDPEFVKQAYGYSSDRAFGNLSALRVSWLRINVIWAEYRRYGFTPYDNAVDQANRHGVSVQMTLFGTPSNYDRGGSRYIGSHRPSASRFGRWAGQVAAHFKGRVGRYSIWNEPNLPQYLSPHSAAPRLYRGLYRAGYSAIRRADPGAKIFFGELVSTHDPLGFMRRAAHGLRADGLAYHPFQFFTAPGKPDHRYVGISNTPKIQATLRSLRRSHGLRTRAGGTLPLYYTEFGYLTRGYIRTSPESKRARWAVEAFRYAKRHHVRQLLWYQLVHPPQKGVWDSGLITRTGSKSKTYRALVKASTGLAGPRRRSQPSGAPSPAPAPPSPPLPTLPLPPPAGGEPLLG